jgi:TRAP-type C4-dicarboxylate transport system substrate-binding protein
VVENVATRGKTKEDPMRPFSRSGLAAFLVAGSILPVSLASAQEVKDRTIKLAFVNAPESAHDLGAKRFAQLVHEKSGGKLKVKLYAGGTLGGEAVVASSLQGGTIEMSMMGPGILTALTRISAFSIPHFCSTATRKPMPSWTAPSERSCSTSCRTRT